MIESCFSQVANFCWKGTLFRAFCREFYGIFQNSYFSGRFWVLEFRPSEVSLSLKVLNTPLISKVEIARMKRQPTQVNNIRSPNPYRFITKMLYVVVG